MEQFLPQCLDSIISQTYKDFEVILVDDGSPDGSGAICDQYAEKDCRFRVIHKQNAGVSAARNTGIEAAKGEWISFIDSDDFVDSDYLEAFHLDDNDADLIIQGLEYFDSRNSTFFKKIIVNDCVLNEGDLKQNVASNSVLHSGYPVAKAYRRSIIKKGIWFDTSISFHEDHIFVLDAISAATNIRLVNSVAYKYRYYHTVSSLSQKRHPWQNLNVCAMGMIKSLDNLKHKYLEDGSDYAQSIYHFAYSPKISAVNELFRTSDGYSATKANYFAIINKKEFRRWYHPQDKKGKLYRNIMLHLPFCGVYLFFKTLVKYQNRNK